MKEWKRREKERIARFKLKQEEARKRLLRKEDISDEQEQPEDTSSGGIAVTGAVVSVVIVAILIVVGAMTYSYMRDAFVFDVDGVNETPQQTIEIEQMDPGEIMVAISSVGLIFGLLMGLFVYAYNCFKGDP